MIFFSICFQKYHDFLVVKSTNDDIIIVMETLNAPVLSIRTLMLPKSISLDEIVVVVVVVVVGVVVVVDGVVTCALTSRQNNSTTMFYKHIRNTEINVNTYNVVRYDSKKFEVKW